MTNSAIKVKNGNSQIFYACLIASVFIIQAAPTQVTPHVALLCNIFSDKAMTTVMYLATIPNLICVPASLLVGVFIRRFGIKTMLVIGAALYCAGGFLPLFADESFMWLVICRFICGAGYGILYSLAVTLVSSIWEEGQLRQHMMGLGTCFQLLGVVGYSFIGGYLVSHMTGTSGIWWVTFLMVPCLILGIFAKLPPAEKKAIEAGIIEAQNEKDAAKAEAKLEKAAPKKNEKLNGYVWFYLISMVIIGLVLNEIFVYISNIIVDNGMGDVTDVAGVVSAHAIVAAILAPTYGFLYKLIGKRWILVMGTVMCIIGNFIMGTCSTVVGMYIGACLHHVGFGYMFSAYMMIMVMVCPPAKVALMNGWSVAAMNLGGFMSGNVMIWLCSLFGRPEDLQFAMILGAIIYIALTIAFIVVKPKIDYTQNPETGIVADGQVGR